jgi:A/G-specific adenine glycosylase
VTTTSIHAALRKSLLAWYRANRRDLPWRRTRDPYGIWISEAMLQQTRVETVLDYWPKFLGHFPDIASLAAAREADVLAAWSGLGYYRRARSLREAARAIVERHGGEFPTDRASVLDLPGVGPYTAGAVLSIAFDQREPLVDGNVARVFSRLFAIEGELSSPESQRRLWQLATELLPPRSSSGEWNQALMELGAMVCTPRDPKCSACPLARHCAALAENKVAQLPRPKARPSPLDVDIEVLIVRRDGAWLFEQRPQSSARMAGLWELPTREVGSPSGLFRPSWEPAGLFAAGRELSRLRHSITRHRITVQVREGVLSAKSSLPAQFQWFEVRSAKKMALTGMAKKVLALAT